jgi:hypothetical protein
MIYNNINIYMAHRVFNNNFGKKTFQVFSEPKDASEYTYDKKARATYCVANKCSPSIKVGSEGNLLLFNRANKLSVFPCTNTIDNQELYINLLTNLDLSGVPVIEDFSGNQIPSTIDNNSIPYLRYNIDPSGNLFGNSPCGLYNYVNYMTPINQNQPI